MPKTKTFKPEKKKYNFLKEDAHLKPSFNFHDFMEDSKKKLKDEYKKETLAMSMRKYHYQEDVIPQISEYTKEELKEKKKWEDKMNKISTANDGYEWVLVKKKIKK